MKNSALVLLLLFALAPSTAPAQEAPALDAEKRTAIVDRLAETLQEVYILVGLYDDGREEPSSRTGD